MVWIQTLAGFLILAGLFAMFLAAIEERKIDQIHTEWTQRNPDEGGD